jgi:5-methylcytosine-specific restriction enzyme subunit McrC
MDKRKPPIYGGFENIVFGFIEKEMESLSAKSQEGSKYLDNTKIFSIRPDLVIHTKDRRFIADTKYKIVYSDASDKHNGISQSDLYQMIAYALRFKIDKVKLLYPGTINDSSGNQSTYEVEDSFAENQKISISAHQIPIINKTLFDEISIDSSLNTIFDSTRAELKRKLGLIFN